MQLGEQLERGRGQQVAVGAGRGADELERDGRGDGLRGHERILPERARP
jgi:hypothetical protein